MFKVDLHTHSLVSRDGALTVDDYSRMLETRQLSAVAVTDHNEIKFAQALHKQLGARVIIGEEINCREGELIGLFLKELVKPGQTAVATARHIRAQGGLVYVPHPYEKLRKGLPASVLDKIVDLVDIVEVYNGRASLDAQPKRAEHWARAHSKAMAASSDAHGRRGWGRTYSDLQAMPTRQNLVELLSTAQLSPGKVGPVGRLYPKLNRVRKKVRRRA